MYISKKVPLKVYSDQLDFPTNFNVKGLLGVVVGRDLKTSRKYIQDQKMPFKASLFDRYHEPRVYSTDAFRMPGILKNRITKEEIPKGYKAALDMDVHRDRNVLLNLSMWTQIAQSRMKTVNRHQYIKLPDVLQEKAVSDTHSHKSLIVFIDKVDHKMKNIEDAKNYSLYQALYSLTFYDHERLLEFLSFFDSCIFINSETKEYFSFLRSAIFEDSRFKIKRFRARLAYLASTGDESDKDADLQKDDEADSSDVEQAREFMNTTIVGKKIGLQINTLNWEHRAKYLIRLQKIAKDNDVEKANQLFKELQNLEVTKNAIALKRMDRKNFTRPIPKSKPVVLDSSRVPTLNEGARKSNLIGFTEEYTNTLLKEDIKTVFESLADKSELPMKMESLEIEDTSDALNRKDTYTSIYTDEKGKKHSLKIDVPRVYEGKKMRIGGAVKSIVNQVTRLPVVKTQFNRVEITTQSNKVTLEVPQSSAFTAETKMLKNALKKDQINSKFYKRGNVSEDNQKHVIPVDYSELAKQISVFNIADAKFVMSQIALQKEIDKTFGFSNLRKQVEKDWGDFSERFAMVGLTSKQLIYYDMDNSTIVYKNVDNDGIVTPVNGINTVSSEIIRLIKEVDPAALKSKPPKKVAFTIATISKKKIPLAVLLCVKNGIEWIFNVLNIDYQIDLKDSIEESKNTHDGRNWDSKIQFDDATLYFNDKNIQTMLITNGLYEIDFSDIRWQDANDPPSAYVDYFTEKFGNPMTLRGSLNIMASLIDPITRQILIDLGLPTENSNLLIYASNLLDNAYFLPVNDMRNYRIRGAEIVPALLAKKLSRSFEQLLLDNRQGRPGKLSVKQNSLIQEISSERLVDDISVLNPINSIENNLGKVTFKGGAGGINMEFAFNSNDAEPRMFHESMMGRFTLGTPDSSGVGIIRYLTADMQVDNLRGYIGDTETGKLNGYNMLGFSELLSPFTNRHSDPARAAMKNLCGRGFNSQEKLL